MVAHWLRQTRTAIWDALGNPQRRVEALTVSLFILRLLPSPHTLSLHRRKQAFPGHGRTKAVWLNLDPEKSGHTSLSYKITTLQRTVLVNALSMDTQLQEWNILTSVVSIFYPYIIPFQLNSMR